METRAEGGDVEKLEESFEFERESAQGDEINLIKVKVRALPTAFAREAEGESSRHGELIVSQSLG